MIEIAILLLMPAVAPPVPGPGQTTSRAQQEDLTNWPTRFEVQIPQAGPTTLICLPLPPGVFGKAQEGLADLRLVDAAGKSVPYALRIRAERKEPSPVTGRLYNPVIRDDGSLECSIDLGEQPGEHNEVSIPLAGPIYRRPVRISGSDDGTTWNKLLDDVFLTHMEVGKQSIDQRRFSYPPSRYRFLRVQVGEDLLAPRIPPRLESFQVWRTMRIPAVLDTRAAKFLRFDQGRHQGSYATTYLIDLGEDRIPVSSLQFDFEERGYSRPYFLEWSTADGQWVPLTSGQLEPRPDGGSPEIRFPNEVVARRLRLHVYDASNEALKIANPRYTAARRDLLFRLPAGVQKPLWLYTGSTNAKAPSYDFEKRLPLAAMGEMTGSVGNSEPNPKYLAPPVPWSERHPRLIDGVLIIAAVILAGILSVLARNAIRRHDANVATAA